MAHLNSNCRAEAATKGPSLFTSSSRLSTPAPLHWKVPSGPAYRNNDPKRPGVFNLPRHELLSPEVLQPDSCHASSHLSQILSPSRPAPHTCNGPCHYVLVRRAGLVPINLTSAFLNTSAWFVYGSYAPSHVQVFRHQFQTSIKLGRQHVQLTTAFKANSLEPGAYYNWIVVQL